MLRNTAIALMKRALTIVETETPELADAHMQVPLSYYRDAHLAAKEKTLFETQPLALVASSEIAKPHDYLVRNAVGRSVLLTRDEDGVAHAAAVWLPGRRKRRRAVSAATDGAFEHTTVVRIHE